MTLADELAKEMKLSDAELQEKMQATEGVTDAGQLLAWATEHVFGPLLKKHEEAIVRLANEIEELKGESS